MHFHPTNHSEQRDNNQQRDGRVAVKDAGRSGSSGVICPGRTSRPYPLAADGGATLEGSGPAWDAGGAASLELVVLVVLVVVLEAEEAAHLSA